MRFRASRVTWLIPLSFAWLVLFGVSWSFGQELKAVEAADTAREPALTAAEQASSQEAAPLRDASEASDKSDVESGQPATEASEQASAAKEPPAGEARSEAEPEKPAAPAEAQPLPPLSKELTALGEQVRRVAVRCYELPLDTSTNTAWDLMEFCLAFGVDAQVRHGSQQINGLGCLCWNFSCVGYQPLLADATSFVPRVGYGFQGYRSQLLAVLGLSAVPASYELRIGQRRGTVTDLVDYEKRTCRSGVAQAHKLIALAYYLKDGESWKNELGDDWSVDRLVHEELDRGVALDSCAATDRMMGLSYAMERRRRSKLPIEGEYARAQRFLDEFVEYALSAQNSDGSWHPAFFAMRGGSRDTVGMLDSTGHIAEWLVYWIADEKLTEPRIARSVGYLADALEAQLSRWRVASTSPQAISAVTHAAHALLIYDRRLFRPYDAKKPAAEPAKNAAS